MKAWLVCVLAASVFAGEAEPAPPKPENVISNGDFSSLGGYKGPVTTTSVGVPANSLPTDWYGGPGVGATATYEILPFTPDQKEAPGTPEHFLRVSWSTAIAQDWPGESHHLPAFRYTFIEYFGIKDVYRLSGKTVAVEFRARSSNDGLVIVPILWHSYDAVTPGIVAVKGKGYELFEASGKPGEVGVAQGAPRPEATCALSTQWEAFRKIITLPDVAGRSITPGHYTGVGFDATVRAAPLSIDIADLRVTVVEPSDETSAAK